MPNNGRNGTMSFMSLKGIRKEVVEEVPYGMYVWLLPNGEVVTDEEGNVMNVFCMKNDLRAIAALTEAARGYGFPEGQPVWWAGKRRLTDEEFEEQLMREKWGLEPDPLNWASIKDSIREKQQHG